MIFYQVLQKDLNQSEMGCVGRGRGIIVPLWTRNCGAFKSTESSFAKLKALKDSTAVWELYHLLSAMGKT